jgi:hypothetical protein
MGRRATGHFLISFTSDRFDVGAEPPNPINPIAGHSFLSWLKPRLEEAGYRVDDPGTEDWGWYVVAEDGAGRRSIVGASADPESRGEVEWCVQLQRFRTFRQWLRREPVMTRDDPLLRLVESLITTRESGEVGVEERPASGRFW